MGALLNVFTPISMFQTIKSIAMANYLIQSNASINMKIEVFTEGSSTTANREDVEYVKDFFKGTFLPVYNLAEKLGKYGDVSVNILSNEYGYLRGSDRVQSLSDEDNQSGQKQFSKSLMQAAKQADVVVVLLSKSAFKASVSSQWGQIVSNIKKESVWCLGASKSAINSINIEELQPTVEIIVYERVGVARISSKGKKQLLEIVYDKN